MRITTVSSLPLVGAGSTSCTLFLYGPNHHRHNEKQYSKQSVASYAEEYLYFGAVTKSTKETVSTEGTMVT